MSDGFFSSLFTRAFDEQNILEAKADSMAQIASGLLSLGANTLLAACGTLIVGGGVWWFVTRHQRKAEEDTRRIERLRLLHDLEMTFHRLSGERSAFLGEVHEVFRRGTDGWVPLITVLTRSFAWRVQPVSSDEFRPYVWRRGERMALFLADPESIINVAALHEVIFWFRRVWRAYEEDVLTDQDLYSLWRQCLPFVTDGRFTFLNGLFGTTRRAEGCDDKAMPLSMDVAPLVKIASIIVRYCARMNIEEPLHYLGLAKGYDLGKSRIDVNAAHQLLRHGSECFIGKGAVKRLQGIDIVDGYQLNSATS